MKFGKFLLTALRRPVMRKAVFFFCAAFAITLVLVSHNAVSAATTQEYDYQWGITEWLSNNPGHYEGVIDSYNTQYKPPQFNVSGHGLEFNDAYSPLDPLRTPYSFNTAISDPNAFARDANGNRIQGGWYLTPSSQRKWDTAGVNGGVYQGWEYSSSGWVSSNDIVNHYQRYASYLYQRPKPTYTGIAAYNDDGSTPYRDGAGRYWYKEGSVVQIQGTANDLEGYVRNFIIAIHNGSGQGISAGFNFCSWNGWLNDMNTSYFNNYTIAPSSDSGQQWTRNIFRAQTCSEGTYTVYVSVDNRAGVLAQDSGAINTSLLLGVDGTPPTAPQIALTSGSNGGWSNQNTSFYLTGSTDSGSGFNHYEYSIDSGGWTRYGGTVTISNTGWHTIQARAIDNVGNISYSTIYSGIDKTPPTCRPSVAASDWHVGGLPITLTYTDDASGVATQQYSWSQSQTSAGSWQNYTTGQQLLPPGSGPWYLYWRATDVAGNVGTGVFGPYTLNADLAIKLQTPNTGYLTNTDVITSVRVSDNSAMPILPGDTAVLHFAVKNADGSNYTTQSKAVVCPANDSNLIWFRWHTLPIAGTYSMSANITASNTTPRTGWADSLGWSVKVPTENTPPQTTLNDKKPSWFSVQSPNPCGFSSALSWSDWTYANGAFQKRTYTAALNANLKISPTDTSSGSLRIVTATQDAYGNWTMKSGYGTVFVKVVVVWD